MVGMSTGGLKLFMQPPRSYGTPPGKSQNDQRYGSNANRENQALKRTMRIGGETRGVDGKYEELTLRAEIHIVFSGCTPPEATPIPMTAPAWTILQANGMPVDKHILPQFLAGCALYGQTGRKTTGL